MWTFIKGWFLIGILLSGGRDIVTNDSIFYPQMIILDDDQPELEDDYSSSDFDECLTPLSLQSFEEETRQQE